MSNKWCSVNVSIIMTLTHKACLWGKTGNFSSKRSLEFL